MKVKKYLGQHFLKNKKIIREIMAAAELSKKDTVLEIGPGHGELTGFLAASAKKVIAVEKDTELIPVLEKKFADVKNIKIISGDIRNWKLEVKNYKVAANIPYYLTSRFLRKFLEAKNKPKLMVLMVQYEVAKRICAKPPEMNLLALSVQAYAKPEFIRKVSKKYFFPVPKVDSAIIKLSNIEGSTLNRKMFELARRAFQQKRKMLRHSLKSDSDVTSESDFGKKRPQELSLEDWKKILKF